MDVLCGSDTTQDTFTPEEKLQRALDEQRAKVEARLLEKLALLKLDPAAVPRVQSYRQTLRNPKSFSDQLDAVFLGLGSSPQTGLTRKNAQKSLAAYGRN